uniref:Uncharacterized protein n=1 Tax=Thermofilum adornatum TaxID=1365176 RepID=A0A7C1GP75_9CREN
MSRMKTTPDAKWGVLLYFYMLAGHVLDRVTTYINIYFHGEVEANSNMASLIPYPHLYVAVQLILFIVQYILVLLLQRQLLSLFRLFRIQNPDACVRAMVFQFCSQAWIGFINNITPGRPLASLIYP